MGAENSRPDKQEQKAHKRKSREPPTHAAGQDIVRGQRLTIPTDGNNDNRLSSNASSISDAGADEEPLYDNNQSLLPGAGATVSTDRPPELPAKNLPRVNLPTSGLVAKKQKDQGQGYTEQTPSSGVIRVSQHSERSSTSEREEELESPVIIRSVPDTVPEAAGSGNNMNTIKQAKVNVRNKITFFKETNAPIIPDKNKRPPGYRTTHIEHPTSNESHNQLPIRLLPTSGATRSASHIGDMSRPTIIKDKHRHNDKTIDEDIPPALPKRNQPSETRRTSEPAIIADHKKKSSTTPFILDPADVKKSPADAYKSIEPEIDYEDNDRVEKDGGWTDAGRIGTLDYFKQVPRDHSLLRGFEKAKPAARQRRAGQSPGNGFNKPRPPRGGASGRPVTMFDARQRYGSNPDILGAESEQSDDSMAEDVSFSNSRVSNQENLVSINTKTGQKYAMDDTAYETLSRKKKIVGQRLAIGVVDKSTEKNFLMSLKRNLQFKQAKHLDDESDSDTDNTSRQPRLQDMMF